MALLEKEFGISVSTYGENNMLKFQSIQAVLRFLSVSKIQCWMKALALQFCLIHMSLICYWSLSQIGAISFHPQCVFSFIAPF